MRNQRENLLSQLGDAAGWDDVVRKRGSTCRRYRNGVSAGVQNQGRVRSVGSLVGIEDGAAHVVRYATSGRDGLEISAAEGVRRQRQTVEFAAGVVDSQNIPEKEKFVSQDAAAEVSAVVIISRRGLRRDAGVLKERHGGQSADAVELISRAVKIIRARFQNDVGDGAARASELRRIVARAYVHGLDCLGWRNIDLQ